MYKNQDIPDITNNDMPDSIPDITNEIIIKDNQVSQEHLIPDDFELTYELTMMATASYVLKEDVEDMFNSFKLYYQSKDIKSTNWIKMWERWILTSKKFVNHLPKKALDNNLELDTKMIDVAKKYINENDIELEFLKFKNYYISNGTKSTDFKRLWENWCINNKKFKPKNSEKLQEKQEYKWEFDKLKATSEKIEQWLDFTVKIDWVKEYYLNNIDTFVIKTPKEDIKIGWRKIFNPYTKGEFLMLFRVETEQGQVLIEHKQDEIIDIEIL